MTRRRAIDRLMLLLAGLAIVAVLIIKINAHVAPAHTVDVRDSWLLQQADVDCSVSWNGQPILQSQSAGRFLMQQLRGSTVDGTKQFRTVSTECWPTSSTTN